MDDPARSRSDLARRALAWTRRRRDALCDSVQPWEYGSVLRSSRNPDWYELNCVRVEQKPNMSASELIAFADRALVGLGHRLICFEPAAAAMALRAQFHNAGWEVHALVWMHHEGDRASPLERSSGLAHPAGVSSVSAPGVAVERPPGCRVLEVSYDDVGVLRDTWHREDFPTIDASDFHASDFHASVRRESLARGVRVLGLMQQGRPVGFAELDPDGDGIEISAVYVLPEYRGYGRGTALAAAAIAAAKDAEDLWICADAEGRPQHLYARLGFVPVLDTVDFLRLPSVPPTGAARVS